jgi:hypothetical protein
VGYYKGQNGQFIIIILNSLIIDLTFQMHHFESRGINIQERLEREKTTSRDHTIRYNLVNISLSFSPTTKWLNFSKSIPCCNKDHPRTSKSGRKKTNIWGLTLMQYHSISFSSTKIKEHESPTKHMALFPHEKVSTPTWCKNILHTFEKDSLLWQY